MTVWIVYIWGDVHEVCATEELALTSVADKNLPAGHMAVVEWEVTQ